MPAEPLYTVSAAAVLLGVDRSRVSRMAASRGLGRRVHGPRGMLVLTAADIEAMRTRRPGRPRKPHPGG